jgi:hypothetical protein
VLLNAARVVTSANAVSGCPWARSPTPVNNSRVGESQRNEMTLVALARHEGWRFEEVSGRGPATAPCG